MSLGNGHGAVSQSELPGASEMCILLLCWRCCLRGLLALCRPQLGDNSLLRWHICFLPAVQRSRKRGSPVDNISCPHLRLPALCLGYVLILAASILERRPRRSHGLTCPFSRFAFCVCCLGLEHQAHRRLAVGPNGRPALGRLPREGRHPACGLQRLSAVRGYRHDSSVFIHVGDLHEIHFPRPVPQLRCGGSHVQFPADAPRHL
mmetsp:Transcript_59341/g.138977  ORF Transcript_59341/g.138977 Transcript_59341/m.138977 type:complete len:205 (+) Transcript_59341:120-734(+)